VDFVYFYAHFPSTALRFARPLRPCTILLLIKKS